MSMNVYTDMTRLKKRTVNHEKNILFLEGIVKILCLTICCTLYYNNIQFKKKPNYSELRGRVL